MSDHPPRHSPSGADACAAPCPLAVGRRAFLSQSALAAAALALAACGGGGDGGTTAPTSVSSTLRLSDYPALAITGGMALVTLNGARLAIVRTGASSFVALSLVCPHQGSIIGVSGTGFLCPGHGARFDGTGKWVGGQQTTNMRSYATTFDATAGTIAIA